ncbi:MAG: VOC family protein [Gemmatimonadota bacterium]
MGEAAPPVQGVLETGLYVADVDRSVQFYERLFGFTRLHADHRFAALEVIPHRQVLLLFRKGATLTAIRIPGGTIPPHDGDGQLHFAFAVDATMIERWVARLAEQDVALESRVRWERGGESLYFRDPDGNLGELATPGLWWPAGP